MFGGRCWRNSYGIRSWPGAFPERRVPRSGCLRHGEGLCELWDAWGLHGCVDGGMEILGWLECRSHSYFGLVMGSQYLSLLLVVQLGLRVISDGEWLLPFSAFHGM